MGASFPYRDFTTNAYVNNVTTGYVDPINPIAAVKYGRGTIGVARGMLSPDVLIDRLTTDSTFRGDFIDALAVMQWPQFSAAPFDSWNEDEIALVRQWAASLP